MFIFGQMTSENNVDFKKHKPLETNSLNNTHWMHLSDSFDVQGAQHCTNRRCSESGCAKSESKCDKIVQTGDFSEEADTIWCWEHQYMSTHIV